MPVITLITDWNHGDHYLGALKGKILGLMPEANVVDISHQVPAFGYIRAAFILRNSYPNFPKGTIHILGINSEARPETPHLIVFHEGHFFIGADNGIFGLLFNNYPVKAIRLKFVNTTFPEYDVFAETAISIAKGENIDKLGTPYEKLFLPAPLLATIDNSVINGSVIYIDSYYNAITNITKEIFDKIGYHRRFEILVQSNFYKIIKINKHYHETPNGELLALFNSLGMLEIAINQGNAAELLNLNTNSLVRVKFYDTPEREELKML